MSTPTPTSTPSKIVSNEAKQQDDNGSLLTHPIVLTMFIFALMLIVLLVTLATGVQH